MSLRVRDKSVLYYRWPVYSVRFGPSEDDHLVGWPLREWETNLADLWLWTGGRTNAIMLHFLLCICSRGVLGSPEDLMVWSHFIFPNFSFTLIFISIDPWEIVAVLITWTLKKNPITSRLHISYWLVVFSWLNYAFLIQVLYFSTVTHGRVIPWCRPNAFMGPCLGI